MTELFVILFLLSISGLIIGLIKPRLILRWENERLIKFGYRKTIVLLFGFLIVLFFIIIGITTPKQEKTNTLTIATEHTINQPQQIPSCQKSVKEIKTQQTSSYPDRKYYEEIHCGDGNTKVFKLSRQLIDISVYKNGKIQIICSLNADDLSRCDTTYNPYDPNNVIINFMKAPENDAVIRITGAQGLQTEFVPLKPQTVNKVIFDIPALAAKMFYPKIKSILGKPDREFLPDPMLEMDGWAEWDKEGFTLSINYNRYGMLQNMNDEPWHKTMDCAISIMPKTGRFTEDQLRLASNLPKGNSFIVENKNLGLLLTFIIKPAFDINNKLYAMEICL
jgi:hypothetical protein